jgi:hypothetical protein
MTLRFHEGFFIFHIPDLRKFPDVILFGMVIQTNHPEHHVLLCGSCQSISWMDEHLGNSFKKILTK